MDRLVAMEAFVRVFEAGSFSAAARQLRMGQPAISKTIAALERHLDVRLLSRTTRGLTPTDAGQRYYERARRVLDEAAEADIAARDAGASLSGRLRVATAVTFARLHIVPYLGEFLSAHPGLEVELIMNDSRADLVGAGADLALRFGPGSDSTLTGRAIARSPRIVVATPAYFERHGKPRTPSDLATLEAVIVAQPGLREAWTFERDGERVVVATHGRLTVDAAEGARAAVLASLGFSVSTVWMFAAELADGTVTPVLIDWRLPPVDLWAIFPAGRLASARARAFVSFVERRFADAPDLAQQ